MPNCDTSETLLSHDDPFALAFDYKEKLLFIVNQNDRVIDTYDANGETRNFMTTVDAPSSVATYGMYNYSVNKVDME